MLWPILRPSIQHHCSSIRLVRAITCCRRPATKLCTVTSLHPHPHTLTLTHTPLHSPTHSHTHQHTLTLTHTPPQSLTHPPSHPCKLYTLTLTYTHSHPSPHPPSHPCKLCTLSLLWCNPLCRGPRISFVLQFQLPSYIVG